MKYLSKLLVIIVVYMSIATQEVQASSCMPLTQKEYFENDFIFLGRYLRLSFSVENLVAFMTGNKENQIKNFEILEPIKGGLNKGGIISMRGSFGWPDKDEKVFFARSHDTLGILINYCAQAMYHPGNPLGGPDRKLFTSYVKEVEDFNSRIKNSPNDIALRIEKAVMLEGYEDYKSTIPVYEEVLDRLFKDDWRNWENDRLVKLRPELTSDIFNSGVMALGGLANAYQEAGNYKKSYKYAGIVNEVSKNDRTIRVYQLSAIQLGKEGELDKQKLLMSSATIFKRKGIDFSGLDVALSDFRGSKIYSVNFTSANLYKADFRNAEISGVNFESANLEEVDFSHDRLRYDASSNIEANFSHSNLKNAKLINLNLEKDSSFDGADLSGAKLNGSLIRTLRGAKLGGADLTGADLRNADIQDINLKNVIYDATTKWPEGFVPRQHE